VSGTTDTAHAVSPDSGEHWSAPGAWPVAEGIHRVPLPLPNDGLKAVNVYVLADDDGLTLVDGGWAIPEARDLLEASLRTIGAGVGDVRRFLVTHAHRDHYTMARVLGTEAGADVALGSGERPSLEQILHGDRTENPFVALLRSAGAHDVAERWASFDRQPLVPGEWALPDTWLAGGEQLTVGARSLEAINTPGHTPGHVVFADHDAGLLLAGDHVLPTITPSIGFSVPVPAQPLGDFMASLTRVRALPDLVLLPAHGPVGGSSHQRVDELLAFHEDRLAASLAALVAGARTAADTAGHLGWTRHLRAYDSLDTFNQGMAAMETKAHLELLVARGDASRAEHADGVRFTPILAGTSGGPVGT
jgi:glyoxylase-like metal-dependent hydrolase (beta-lactamase superfamily II)